MIDLLLIEVSHAVQLCTTRMGRQTLRQRKIYPILRCGGTAAMPV